MTAVTSDFGAQENKISHCFHFFPSICHEVMGPDAMILVFWMLSFKPAFSLSSFTLIKRLFSSSLSVMRVISSAYLRLLIFLLKILIPAWASSKAILIIFFLCLFWSLVSFKELFTISSKLFGFWSSIDNVEILFLQCLKGMMWYLLFHSWYCCRKVCVGGLAARHSKTYKRSRLVEMKVCFISDAGNRGSRVADICPKADPCPWQAAGESFYRQIFGRGRLHAETAQTSLTVIFKVVISGLASIILVVLGTVNLQFWGGLVPISLQSVLRIVAALTVGRVWSLRS